MSGKGSSKLDIAEICDAIAGTDGIGQNVSDILDEAQSSTLNNSELLTREALGSISQSLREVVHHLRIITGENPMEGEL